jgi:hypothetical protein
MYVGERALRFYSSIERSSFLAPSTHNEWAQITKAVSLLPSKLLETSGNLALSCLASACPTHQLGLVGIREQRQPTGPGEVVRLLKLE